MKIYRYMSTREFALLSAGVTLENKNTFRKCRTTSKGFCFLPEVILCGSVSISPVEALDFLNGIVTDDVLVEFEAMENSVNKSEGIYYNPFDYELMVVEEYCVNSYNRETLVPCRYAVSGKWYDFN